MLEVLYAQAAGVLLDWERTFLSAHLSLLGNVHPETFRVQLHRCAREVGRVLPQSTEGLLRLMDSNIYLIAVPTIMYPESHSLLFHTGDKQYPYAIGYTMNGLSAAKEYYENLSITDAANFVNLGNAGFLVPRHTNSLSSLDNCGGVIS